MCPTLQINNKILVIPISTSFIRLASKPLKTVCPSERTVTSATFACCVVDKTRPTGKPATLIATVATAPRISALEEPTSFVFPETLAALLPEMK